MSVRISLHDDARLLTPERRDLVLNLARAAASGVEHRAPCHGAKLLLVGDLGPHEEAADGMAYSGMLARIDLDVTAAGDPLDLERGVLVAVVHELHHVLRWRHISRWTVAELVALEGLAFGAEAAVLGWIMEAQALPPPEPRALPPPDRATLRRLASEVDAGVADAGWLFAKDTAVPPVYRLGYAVIGALAARGTDAFEDLATDARTLAAEGLHALEEDPT